MKTTTGVDMLNHHFRIYRATEEIPGFLPAGLEFILAPARLFCQEYTASVALCVPVQGTEVTRLTSSSFVLKDVWKAEEVKYSNEDLAVLLATSRGYKALLAYASVELAKLHQTHAELNRAQKEATERLDLFLGNMAHIAANISHIIMESQEVFSLGERAQHNET